MVSIIENYEVKRESTFKIGGKIKKAAFPADINELIKLLQSKEYDIVLGNCSNILFGSGYINKNIIFTKYLNKFSFDGSRLLVSSGVKGPLISKECRKRNLTGFEFLIGFPGSFGGMIAMNAAAHGQAISDTFVLAKLYDLKQNKIAVFSKHDMNFSYRNSILSCGNYVVLEAEFELKCGNPEEIKDIMDRNIVYRKEHQPPLNRGNAGSIFKNPNNDSAGRLLDLCSLKGVSEGGAAVYQKHANFIVNYNNASSKDVLKLMYKMYSGVKEKYGIELEPEIIYIGEEQGEERDIWLKMKKENTRMIKK